MTRSAPQWTQRSRLRELLLTAGAVAGVVCVLVALASAALGVKPLVFRSGSMSPAIETGALALAETVPASELRIGDVVSVVTPQARLTHRIVDIQPLGNRAALVLQGDANDVPDAAPYVVDSVDRVFFHVNGLGYAISWLSSPMAVFAGGVLVGAALVIALSGPEKRPRVARPIEPGQHRASAPRPQGPHRSVSAAARGKTGVAVAVAAVTLVAGGAAGTAALDTEAAFTDGAAASAAMSTLTVAPTSDAACTKSGGALLGLLSSNDVAVIWTHRDARYHYRVEVFRRGSTGGTPLVTRNIAPGSAVGTTVGTTFSPNQLSTSSNEFTVLVTSYLRDASAWRSGGVGVPVKEDPGGLLRSNSLLCG